MTNDLPAAYCLLPPVPCLLPAAPCPLPAGHHLFPQGFEYDFRSGPKLFFPFPNVTLVGEAVVAVPADDQMIEHLNGHDFSG